MTLKLLCLPGDGIGPEITAATVAVLEAAEPLLSGPLELSDADIGFASLQKYGETIPEAVLNSAKASDGVILGPVSHNAYPPVEQGGRNPSGVLRVGLDLYANIRPALTWPGLTPALGKAVDLVVVRENLEGFYADRNMHSGAGEFMPEPGVALAVRKITERGSLRIARAGFRLAADRGARKVTAVHKANVMRMTDGVFLDCVRRVAAEYPGIDYEEVLVDAAAALLVRDPSRFEVIITTNMFGDILSDLASELSGGLGLAGSLNHGDQYSVAQAQHGSAPDIAGQDKANPVSLMLSVVMLLDHLAEARAATAIRTTIAGALQSAATRTVDLGGALGTKAFADHIVHQIKQALT